MLKSWRTPNQKKPDFETKHEPYPATRFLDNMSFIGDVSVACFLVETSEGLILIDCMWDKQEYYDMILKGIEDLGYSLSDLKAILITHGHADHYGYAGQLREATGAKLYMSQDDYELAKDPNRSIFPPIEFEVDDFLKDGDLFTLGDTSIKCVLTPGHTEGCMSFIIPVTDEGRPHQLAIWGGTGLLPSSNKEDYLVSVEKFSKVCDEYGVDAEISNHPFVDNGIERMNVIRNISIGVPNPFIIGQENYKRYEDRFRQMCLNAINAEKSTNK